MSIKNLNENQRKVYEACRNGWLVGGEYRAKFDNHEKDFFADSPSWLFREVDAKNHSDSSILVNYRA